MKVRDKNVKQMVDVSDKECPTRECYWPRPDPGVFTQGAGYRTRNPGHKADWLCGTREMNGCPEDKPKSDVAKEGMKNGNI